LAGFSKAIFHSVVQNACFSTDGRGVNRDYKSAFCSTMTLVLFAFWLRILHRQRINLQGFENKKRGGGGGTKSCQLSAVSYQKKPGALVVGHISIVRRGMEIICNDLSPAVGFIEISAPLGERAGREVT
jgi:hypothetical protein